MMQPPTQDFRALFEGAPGLYLVLTPDFNIVAVSDAYLRATMTARDAIVGRHLFEVFPDNPDDSEATGVGNLRTSLEAVLSTRRADTMAVQKYDIRRPEDEGGAFEVRYWSPLNAPVLDHEGEVAFIIHRVEDVTEFVRLKQEEAANRALTAELLSGVERAEAEVYERAQQVLAANRRLEAANAELAALRRQADEKNALLMATAQDAKFVLDAAGVVLEVNSECERMLARAATEIVGRSLTDFFPSAERADSLRLGRPGGADVYVDVAAAPIPIGESGQSLFVAREVSDRVKLEEQLRQSQKLEAIGQLTGGVAHDFNNLLTVITTTSELLEDRLRGQPELLNLVEMIAKSADRGARLAHRMLAFARRQPLQPQAVDLNEIVAGMTMMLSRTLGEEILLSNALAPDLWPVLADGSQIEDALLNLAVNARDAMPRGGELIIETANAHFDNDDAAQMRDLAAGDYVVLAVSDTGVGMAPDVAARAIEPFFTTKEVGEGTGLGLSMIYGFVKQSRGNLAIYSEPGFGTSIKLFLPRAREPARDAKPAHAPPNACGAGETILVVEDDVDVRTVATAMLGGLGYHVRTAEDGPSALRMLREHDDIELLFTDLMMPGGMSGIDLVEAAQRERPGLKALMTSGYPAQMIERRGGAPCGVGLVHKPYRKRDLAGAIRRALAG